VTGDRTRRNQPTRVQWYATQCPASDDPPANALAATRQLRTRRPRVQKGLPMNRRPAADFDPTFDCKLATTLDIEGGIMPNPALAHSSKSYAWASELGGEHVAAANLEDAERLGRLVV